MSALHNRFMTVLLEHLHDELATAGYQVVLIIDAMNETKNLITLRPLIDGYLDGLIFTTATLDSPVVTELQSHGIPIVLVVRSIDNAKVDTIETDNFHAGSEAARHLFELGHRRIGLIMGPANTSTSRDRTRGALFWLEKHGVQRKSIHMVDCEYTHEAGYSAGLGFLRLESPATGIVAGNDTIALGVLDAIRRVGLIVPDHVSVIGFDDIPLAASPLIGLTSIRQPVEIMARTAARRLLSRIASRNIGSAVQHVLPTELILRSSTGPAHGSR